MEAKDVYKLAQIMMAAESKKRTKNIIDSLANEPYQRTFTDEMWRALGMTEEQYRKRYKRRPYQEPLTPEIKKIWELNANRGEK